MLEVEVGDCVVIGVSSMYVFGDPVKEMSCEKVTALFGDEGFCELG